MAIRWPSFKGAVQRAMSSVPGSGWFGFVREGYGGAWQQNVLIDKRSMHQFYAVFACKTLISGDISKLDIDLQQLTKDIWTKGKNSALQTLMNAPNSYQNRIQFVESWILSKLDYGNTYILKARDQSNRIRALYPLNPLLCRPMIATDDTAGGAPAIFYELSPDNMSGLDKTVLVPASEIIHDRWNTHYHPLVGLPPILACGLAASQGHQIQETTIKFFGNGGQPSGVLTAPGRITDATAARLKAHFEENFRGKNVGRIAVLGENLKFEKMQLTAVEAQLLELLKLSAEIVCSVYHVPQYMIGAGATPTYNNIQSLNIQYYSQALQKLIEDFELCLALGLAMDTSTSRWRCNIDNLLRMDTVQQITSLKEGVLGGIYAPNEARAKLNLEAKDGGDSPYLQQQNFSLAALAKRDALDDPFGSVRETFTGPANPADAPNQTGGPAIPAPEPAPAPPPDPQKAMTEELAKYDPKWAKAYIDIGFSAP